MAGDRHGKHNSTTVAFRVNSYEKATIEERLKATGTSPKYGTNGVCELF